MWPAIAQAGISVVTNVLKKRAELKARLAQAKYQRERLQESMNRSFEITGANYVKLREQHLADTNTVTESYDRARSDADTDQAFNNIRGISRNDIDRQISIDASNSQLQANRELTEKLQHLTVQSKQRSANYRREAESIGADAGGFTALDILGIASQGLNAGFQQYSRDLTSLSARDNKQYIGYSNQEVR